MYPSRWVRSSYTVLRPPTACLSAVCTTCTVTHLGRAVEEAGLLSFAADNGPVLINLFGFLAVEPAKLAIPVVSAELS